MKSLFPGYYRPTAEEMSSLWQNCIFVIDTSVLLSLYRYKPATSLELLNILEQVKTRIWIPYQVAKEYHNNRLNVISQQSDAYRDVEDFFTKLRNQIDGKLGSYRNHPYIDVSRIMSVIEAAFSEIYEDVRNSKGGHPDLILNDYIKDSLTNLFESKVGGIYTIERLESIYKEGAERFKAQTPPGYMDEKEKDGNEKYGDLVLWFQIIEMALAEKKSVIFLNNDTKEDWWWKFQGRVIGPKPLLVEEFQHKTGYSFFMYHAENFMEEARKYLSQAVDQHAIDEVRSIRQLDEMLGSRLQELEEELSEVELTYTDISREIESADDSIRQINEINNKIDMSISESDLPDSELADRALRSRNLEDLRLRLDSLIAVKQEYGRRARRIKVDIDHLIRQSNIIRRLKSEK